MAKKFALLFPGQGTVKVGMGKDIYDAHPEAKAIFDEADRILGWPISEICFTGPQDLLIKTVNTQLAVFVVNAAYAVVFRKEHKKKPLFLAGQSLGYLSALLYSEVFSFKHGLEIVKRRAELMEEQCLRTPGAMVAIKEPKNVRGIKHLCEKIGIVISNYNLDEIVISGRVHLVNEAVEEIKKKALADRKMTIPLRTEGAFHSELMRPVKKPLADFLKSHKFSNPKIPIIGNSGAQIINSAEAAKKEIIEHLDKPVLWQQSIEKMMKGGVENFEEMGAGRVLSKNLKRWLIALGLGASITVGLIYWFKKFREN